MNSGYIVIIFSAILLITGAILIYCDIEDKKLIAQQYEKERYNNFLEQFHELSPEEFFELRRKKEGDIVGVYILYNETKKLSYVGQATRLFFRINQHLTGSGNGDVYADYKYGDKFWIRIIPLTKSKYNDLDKLERDTIKMFDSYNHGYNKTHGNNV